MGVKIVKYPGSIIGRSFKYKNLLKKSLQMGDLIKDADGFLYLVCDEENAEFIMSPSLPGQCSSKQIYKFEACFLPDTIVYLPEKKSLSVSVSLHEVCMRKYPCKFCKKRFSCWNPSQNPGFHTEDYRRFLCKEEK